MAEVILVNRYGYTAKPAWQGARPEAKYLSLGDEVTRETFADANIGQANELKRGRDMGAIGDPEVLYRRAAALAAPAPTPEQARSALNDAEFGPMSVEELAAHANQFPGDVDRIVRLEVLRGTKARKGVLELANLAGQTPEEEQAEREQAASGTS